MEHSECSIWIQLDGLIKAIKPGSEKLLRKSFLFGFISVNESIQLAFVHLMKHRMVDAAVSKMHGRHGRHFKADLRDFIIWLFGHFTWEQIKFMISKISSSSYVNPIAGQS